ncbi:hypothetical protein L3X38_003189 [Prunus dulcis]|uniref:Uncharacterized protein n=1 Tax=Prunus dulcis TaxID=3755 RepID=A0AAD5F1L5_PRUDU|nr:hypothetical protein L3X38_003189 [Prunus dulcis]
MSRQAQLASQHEQPSASLPPLRAHVTPGLPSLAPACPAQAHIGPRPSVASPSSSPSRRPRPTPPFFHFKPSACRLKPANLATLQQMHAGLNLPALLNSNYAFKKKKETKTDASTAKSELKVAIVPKKFNQQAS